MSRGLCCDLLIKKKLNICKLWNEHNQCYLHRHEKMTFPHYCAHGFQYIYIVNYVETLTEGSFTCICFTLFLITREVKHAVITCHMVTKIWRDFAALLCKELFAFQILCKNVHGSFSLLF